MKVLLMVAPSADALTLENSNDIAQSMGFYPPLGILYVGTYLKLNSLHQVRVVDSEAERLTLEDIQNRVREFRPDIVGLTAFTNTLHGIIATIQAVKEVRPGCRLVIGGPHVALYPNETLDIAGVDFAVRGDGEYAFKDLLDILENPALSPEERNAAFQRIEGLVFRGDNGEIVINGYARVQNLDDLPFPDRSFLKRDLYFCILGKNRLMTTIMSSRGCPFRCTFCNTPDKIYRYRSPKSVVDEMEYVAGLGVEEVFFFDDLFNINEARVLEVCDEIIRRKINIKWAFRGRISGVTDLMIRKAKDAGCERIQYGIEKATDESLKRVRKDITVQEIIEAVKLTKKHGLMCVGNFLLFTPGEDERDAEEIIRFSLQLKLDHAEYSVFIPYPGSAIYDDGLKSGFFKQDYWRDYVKKPDPNFQIVWEEKVPKARMYEISNRAHKRFYFRPRIIWNEFRRVSSLKEFLRAAKGALIIFKL